MIDTYFGIDQELMWTDKNIKQNINYPKGHKFKEMNNLFCQSCGMPLENDDVTGTNKDCSKNNDYCIYCYKDGNFTQDVTMDEMIAISLRHMKELFKDDSDFDEQTAVDNMKSFFPKLKRWVSK